VVAVPDERLDKLAALENSEKVVPTTIEFVDIAGLVSGAHKGEGLGNQFLAHIREVDAIIEVVRVFENKDIIHVSGSVDPVRDAETIAIELQLADLQNVTKRLENVTRLAKNGEREMVVKKDVLEKYRVALEAGQMASTVVLNEEEKLHTKDVQLLTTKPFLYVANSEYNMENKNFQFPISNFQFGIPMQIDAKIEAELSELDDNDRLEYMKDMGMTESGLDKIIREAYKTLGLITFITAGPKESKAWTCRAGTKAPQAAGVIHTDFERGFIRAEVIAWDKLLEAGGYPGARDKGWLRVEGKEYVVQDGDVVHFRFNV
jgi:GTP-binding protein YchF